jgi:predicted O-linked N-acetylglucosamine transferase (SPINDLY family)
MCNHTVGAYLMGWVGNHDLGAVEIYCYHVGYKADELTAEFQRTSHQFYHFPGDVESTANQIASDELHVLVYSDIGMNIETLQLAAMRLAPVQCKGWGHPVTTGMMNIDYYLTSDLMETEIADQYYSETLIRLPNLALCYQPPQLPAAPLDRAELSIEYEAFLFLSTQSIFKYLPQHDEIYPRIASQVPHARFVFISHQSQHATQRFRNRLRTAFARHRLDADRFCFIAPRMAFKKFLALNMTADVLLDTFDWSGGKTTLEAITCGLPVITCPGKFMRGRHAYAMLTMMGICDTIARDPSEYCRIAIRLASDRSYYNLVQSKFKAERHRLFNDKSVIKELEKFYYNATKR